jgi:hypothetical protein
VAGWIGYRRRGCANNASLAQAVVVGGVAWLNLQNIEGGGLPPIDSQPQTL